MLFLSSVFNSFEPSINATILFYDNIKMYGTFFVPSTFKNSDIFQIYTN